MSSPIFLRRGYCHRLSLRSVRLHSRLRSAMRFSHQIRTQKPTIDDKIETKKQRRHVDRFASTTTNDNLSLTGRRGITAVGKKTLKY